MLSPRIVIHIIEAKSLFLLTRWFNISLLLCLYCYKNNNSRSNSFDLKTNFNTELTFFLRGKLYFLHLKLATRKVHYLGIFCNFTDRRVSGETVFQPNRCYNHEESSFLDGLIGHHLLFASLWISTSASVKSLCTKVKLWQMVLGADSYLRSPPLQVATLLKEESFSGQMPVAALFHLRTRVHRIITQKTCGLFLI